MDGAGGATRERPRPEGREGLFAVGAAAAGVGMAALWLASSVVPPIVFPQAALAEAIVRAAPGDLATLAIELLDRWALRLLTGAVLGGSLAVGGLALVLTAGPQGARPPRAAAWLAALTLVVLLLAGGGVGAPSLAAIVLAAGAYALTASLLLRPASAVDLGRRRTLGAGLAGAAAVALAAGALGWLLRRLAGPDTDVPLRAARRPARVPGRRPFPAIEGLTREVTKVSDHYVVDINLIQPAVDAEGWELEVRGEVERPLRLTFEELQQRFEVVEEYAVLACVSNEVGGDLVGHSLWGGVRLGDVLSEAGLLPGAIDLVLHAADGYSDSIPAELAGDPSVLLAIAQNRRPLTQEHGFPCRLRVPPIYGMKNVKWITSIEAVDSDHRGYWQRRGWSDDATVRTQSRIDVAGEDGSALVGRPTWIAGVAWAGDRGVSRVEVSTDGASTWTEALLRAPVGPLSWRQWALPWTPERTGAVEVVCRATDGLGRVQTAAVAPPHPAGATGLHRVTVDVA